jgi:histidine kinase
LLVTTNDITQRLEAEQQLIQASKMATLGEMATGVAHELNQPLSVIKTAAGFCLRKIARSETIDLKTMSDMLAKVDTNADRAARIIVHMRQFARKSDISFSRIVLNEVLHSAFEIFSQQLKARGIEVHWDLHEDLPKIEADAQRLEQVIINLLLNARDAIEAKRESAHVTDPSDYITIASRKDNGNVVCLVCDTGIGIPAGHEEKIFEPFYTTKEVGKGTGLGLSISYGIVRECRGTIRCLTGRHKGACFELSFPAAGRQAHSQDQGGLHGDRDRTVDHSTGR